MEKEKVEKFLNFLVGELLEDNTKISIELKEDENAYNYEIKAPKEEIGKLIGKGGKTAEAIRMITRTVAGKTDKRVFIKINEIA
jgi:predicted RNA-binding protein YlqC (UPF0109 family)